MHKLVSKVNFNLRRQRCLQKGEKFKSKIETKLSISTLLP